MAKPTAIRIIVIKSKCPLPSIKLLQRDIGFAKHQKETNWTNQQLAEKMMAVNGATKKGVIF
jgi:hypothetical protein